MKQVTRKEKLMSQMGNIEAALNSDAPAEQKVYAIISTMSYLNHLVSDIIEPLREEAGESYFINLAESNFIHFIEPKNEE